MPYKESKYNRYRQRSPNDFYSDSFRTIPLSRASYTGTKFKSWNYSGSGAKAIVGVLKKHGGWTIQSILIPKGKPSTIFMAPRWQKYAEMVSHKDIKSGKKSIEQLKKEFKEAKSRRKKLRIATVTNLSATRARESAKRKKISSKQRKELREISRLYRTEAVEMFEEYNKEKK